MTTAPSPLPPASPAASPASPAVVNIRVLAGWKRLLAVLAGLLVRLWCRTLRLTFSTETRRLLLEDPRPAIFTAWHNRLFVVTELVRQLRPGRRLHNLISASKDGAWLSAFFESAGLRAVRGSSSRGGREAVHALVEVLRAGHDVGITPDGPRGPLHEFKPGALIVARRARARIILVGLDYERAWILRSWDRFLLPRPFSRVHIHAAAFEGEALHADTALADLQNTLRALNPDSRHAATPPAHLRPPAPDGGGGSTTVEASNQSV